MSQCTWQEAGASPCTNAAEVWLSPSKYEKNVGPYCRQCAEKGVAFYGSRAVVLPLSMVERVALSEPKRKPYESPAVVETKTLSPTEFVARVTWPRQSHADLRRHFALALASDFNCFATAAASLANMGKVSLEEMGDSQHSPIRLLYAVADELACEDERRCLEELEEKEKK